MILCPVSAVGPALVACGRHDPQFPLSCSEELAEGIPGARLEVFDASGHYPFIEEADRFRRVVGDLLNADDGPGTESSPTTRSWGSPRT